MKKVFGGKYQIKNAGVENKQLNSTMKKSGHTAEENPNH